MRFRRRSRDERLWGMLVTTVVKHMAAQVSNLEITPNSDVVKYEITREGGKLQIFTREGSSTINDGGRSTTLDAGKLISFECRGRVFDSRHLTGAERPAFSLKLFPAAAARGEV